jgi:hypothetical protein
MTYEINRLYQDTRDDPVDLYKSLRDVLDEAYTQASRGKGKERHATDVPFERQQSGIVTDKYGLGYPLGQADKKCLESMRLEPDAAVAELLGAINYIALAIIKKREGVT